MADLQKFIDELRAKVSIVDIVGQKVKLVRKGREFSGLCPFHNEKTPSFTVNEAKSFYHCFGCGAHGDIVKFEMEANGLPFMDALEKLSRKAGVPMPQMSAENKQESDKRKSYYEIMDMACKYFEKNLKLTGGREALDYLYNRGFEEEQISRFRMGYAPNNNGLRAMLLSKDVAETDIISLGLAGISEKGNSKGYDFFRNRLIIPIMDRQGRVIAFGGRILGEGQPKYLNSPDTPVFNKRQTLYNLHNAREKAYEAEQLIICEGYMDVIALDKFGYPNAVAPLGTALTEEQILQAWRVAPEPILCFDGDSAGVRAGVRSIERALPILQAGNSLKYAFLPDRMDPDDFLKAKGREAFEKLLQETDTMANLLWKKNLEGIDVSTPEQKALFEKKIFSDVALIKDESVRGYYLSDMKDRIFKAFSSYGNKNNQNSKSNFVKKIKRPTIDDRSLIFVIGAIIYMPSLVASYEEKILMFDIEEDVLRNVINHVIKFYNEDNNISSDTMGEKLKEFGFSKELERFWEIGMLRLQSPTDLQLIVDIDKKILDAQIKHIDNEIRECLRVIETSNDFPEDVFNRLEAYKKEKEALVKTEDLFE